MKVAWRLRRLAYQQGLRPRASVPLRFASTASLPSDGSSDAAANIAAVHDSSSEAGPSDYATRAAASSQHGSDTAPTSIFDFFTSSRPTSTPLQEYLAGFSSPDIEKLKHMLHLLNRPRSERDTVLTSSIWSKYVRLTPSVRTHMDHKVLQNVLRAVIPAAEHLPALLRRRREQREENRNAGKKEKTQGHYGDRVLTIMRDMEESLLPPLPVTDGSPREAASGPRPSDYRFALLKLARLGDTQTCEALANRARKSGRPMDIRMIDSRLYAMVQSLRSSPTFLTPLRADRVFQMLWTVMGDIAQYGLTPRNATITFLVQAVYVAKKRIQAETAPGVLANLDVILEDVCRKAYGMNMQYLGQQALGQGEDSPRRIFKGAQVNALVDYWGGKGEVWKMLSLYDVLVDQPLMPLAAQAARMSAPQAEIEDDEPPTLSGALRQEEEDRKAFRWFGLFNGGAVLSTEQAGGAGMVPAGMEGDLSPHLDLPSAETATTTGPVLPGRPSFADFFLPSPAPPIIASAGASPPDLSYPTSLLRTETISVLVRHTVASGDIQLLLHILSSALVSVAQVRTEWLAALQYRHELTRGDPAHPAWFRLPGPRAAINQQWFWEAEDMARAGNASVAARTRLQALMLQARTMMVAERAVLESLLPSDQAVEGAAAAAEARKQEGAPFKSEHSAEGVEAALAPGVAKAAAFNPSIHLDILDASQKKLDSVIERSQGKLEQKVREWHADAAYYAERQVRRAQHEAVKRETAAEKRRGKKAARAEQVADMTVGPDRGAGGWSSSLGSESVRMIGVA